MNVAHLGPKPLGEHEHIDTAPFVIRTWSILDVLGPLGEATLTFTGHAAGFPTETILMVAANPRSGDIVRCTIVYPAENMRHAKVDPAFVPAMVRDLAQTKTLEVFAGAWFSPFL